MFEDLSAVLPGVDWANLSLFADPPILKLLISVAFILAVFVTRTGLIRLIRNKKQILSIADRAWISNVRNVAYIIVVLGLLAIWADFLRTFVLSLAAVAVAVVVATKELLLCVSGFVYRTSARLFSIGDWVEIGGIKGEVIDQDMISTTLQELYLKNNLYEYTGRTVVLPNSQFFTQPIRNEQFIKNYVFHEFSIVVEPDANPHRADAHLREVVQRHTADFRAVAQRYHKLLQSRMGIELMEVEPRIRYTNTDFSKHVITITLFCPTGRALTIEQAVVEEFMAYYYEHIKPPKKE